jgi:hypothetical protein
MDMRPSPRLAGEQKSCAIWRAYFAPRPYSAAALQ